jgi:MFS family permease
LSATRDQRLILAAAGLRATATALSGVLLGRYLADRGFAADSIGAVATAGLVGAAAGALAVTLGGDRFGRRRSLVALSLAGAAGGAALIAAGSVWLIAAVAFLGMVNAMGRDRGGASILEQAVLPSTVSDAERTRTFAWYSAIQDGGHALGSLLAGLPSILTRDAGLAVLDADRVTFAIYPVLLGATALLALGLSPRVERGGGELARSRVSRDTRRVLWRISSLFALDGIGGGLLVTTLLSYFFFERFGAGAGAVALLFFVARLANVASHFGAAWLARRIGLVNTMVFTHIPSSLLLAAVAFVPTFPLAAALFLARECLVEMDVPTRQSYLMGVVGPDERITVSGVTNLVRLGAWAAGAGIAGLVMERVALATPLLLGAALKILYDVLLYLAFRRRRPPEEAPV